MVGVTALDDGLTAVRCPHCAYPAEPRESSCSRCGHDLPRARAAGWPVALMAGAAVVGALLAFGLRRG
jgi:uncharacterized protein (DUF983 family)